MDRARLFRSCWRTRRLAQSWVRSTMSPNRSVPTACGTDLPSPMLGRCGGTGFYRFPCLGSGRSGTVSSRATPSALAPSHGGLAHGGLAAIETSRSETLEIPLPGIDLPLIGGAAHYVERFHTLYRVSVHSFPVLRLRG